VTSNDKYVLDILLENGVLLPDQVEKARQSVDRDGMTALDMLVRDGAIAEQEVLAMLARQFGMELVSLRDLDLRGEVRDSIPADVARKYRVVPVYRAEDVLTVALSDPLDVDILDTLRYLLKCSVEPVVASRDEIQVALDKFYPIETDVTQVLDKVPDSAVDVALTSTSAAVPEETATDADAPIIKLVTLIIVEAYRHRASDIHLEPMEKRFRVRYRIDGVLHEVDSPPKRLQAAIISRVKIMAGMKISEKRVPQDGRIEVNIMGRELDLRVSTVPANHGEAVVMRILDKQSLALGLPNLGFFSDDQQMFERLIQLPDGILLITGPTGSGKTTTLYACLNYINQPDRKIITVEDPVEYQLSGINQVQVREDIGMTFGHALRSILRQAPNIVMIGEIRDKETASIATEASLTGHLVFSTLHTNDAPSAVTRLLDIGLKPFLVSSSLRAVMAQRLVRCVCDNCKEQHQASDHDVRVLGPAASLMAGSMLHRGRGCNKCSLTGYYGRKGIFEIFTVTEEIQRMIYNKVGAVELRVRARENGMRTLREDGLRKAAAGITTIEEVMRNTMGDAD
jgi:general secretion pathway protein E/type IV pilus assembly protein PilB